MYFVVLSIAFGVWVIIAGPVVHLLRKKWAWLRAKKMYPEKRPFGVWASAMIRTLVVGLGTFFLYFRAQPFLLFPELAFEQSHL